MSKRAAENILCGFMIFGVTRLLIDPSGHHEDRHTAEIFAQVDGRLDVGITGINRAVNRQPGGLARLSCMIADRIVSHVNFAAAVSQIFE